MAEQTRKQSLTKELDAARGELAGYARALRHDLSVGERLKSGIGRNPVAWFSAAAVVGLLLSRVPISRRKMVVRGPALRNQQVEKAGAAAVALTALKFGLDFAKPAIVSWLKKQMLDRSASRPTVPK